MEFTIQQTAALVVGFIGITVGGLGSLYCLVLPFLAKRFFVYGMGLLWIRAFTVLLLNGLIAALMPTSGYGSFAGLSVLYVLLVAMLVTVCTYQYQTQKRLRAQEQRFQQRVEEAFR